MNPLSRRACWRVGVSWLALASLLTGAGGCAATLMPTPNLYAHSDSNPFQDVPPALQGNCVNVLYVTDRAREEESSGLARYGYKRSRSVAYGTSEVCFGQNVSWEELVQASRTSDRNVDLTSRVANTTELGRMPPTPKMLVDLSTDRSSSAAVQEVEEVDEVFHAFSRHLSAQLALTPKKEIYVFVHGYNNNFEDSVKVIAELWHFLGREGVPVAYSWPAGSTGLLRGYTYDRESSEFTVFHFKEMLRLIAAHPEVQKVHVISHSRGTEVAVSALRELHLEIGGSGRSTREVLKLGAFVMAAPDLDIEVVIQRFITARLGRIPERFALYGCQHDKALGLSTWLFGGSLRLGLLNSDMFTPEELKALRESKTVQIIDARISKTGAFGHSYFHSNPAVSSDLILLLRYHLPPGADSGRPLRADEEGFWVIDDQYPGGPKASASGH